MQTNCASTSFVRTSSDLSEKQLCDNNGPTPTTKTVPFQECFLYDKATLENTILQQTGSFLPQPQLSKYKNRVVNLTPPAISKDTIAQEIVCTRPMRDGCFNISVEPISSKFESKKIINCYGHGGSGWTTLFGSVKKAIELFENENPQKDVPIRVIGSGCMGLTSAIELTRRGYNVAGIATKSLYDIPCKARGQGRVYLYVS
jgi:hypothetical protein